MTRWLPLLLLTALGTPAWPQTADPLGLTTAGIAEIGWQSDAATLGIPAEALIPNDLGDQTWTETLELGGVALEATYVFDAVGLYSIDLTPVTRAPSAAGLLEQIADIAGHLYWHLGPIRSDEILWFEAVEASPLEALASDYGAYSGYWVDRTTTAFLNAAQSGDGVFDLSLQLVATREATGEPEEDFLPVAWEAPIPEQWGESMAVWRIRESARPGVVLTNEGPALFSSQEEFLGYPVTRIHMFEEDQLTDISILFAQGHLDPARYIDDFRYIRDGLAATLGPPREDNLDAFEAAWPSRDDWAKALVELQQQCYSSWEFPEARVDLALFWMDDQANFGVMISDPQSTP